MNILVIGSGGREHAICKKINESPLVSTVFCAKGNAGMKRDGIQLVDIAEDAHEELIAFAKEHTISWTFVGPETPLFNGIVDDFQAAGLKIFGPNKAAAAIEYSKDFAKTIMMNYDIPTADYQTFTDYAEAHAYVEKIGTPIVIKADGLAAGKGVVVAETMTEATLALKEMMLEKKFGESADKVLVEEFLTGEEFSMLAFVKEDKVYPMVVSQDHKRAYEGDKGPNTGGMGAYTPVPQIDDSIIEETIERIMIPAAKGMIKEGRPFTGILYGGIIATENGPKTIEFNARFGDPETQVVLNRLTSDLAQIIDDLLKDKEPVIGWKTTGFDIGVVVAAQGYPEEYQKGIPLADLDLLNDVEVYAAGVKEVNGRLASNGGRIYLIEAHGETLDEARQKIYNQLEELDTQGCFYRLDIGEKAISAKLD